MHIVIQKYNFAFLVVKLCIPLRNPIALQKVFQNY